MTTATSSEQALADYQATWMALALNPQADVLASPATLDDWLARRQELSEPVRAQFRAQGVGRLRQYRSMVQANLAETLEIVYPYTRQVLAQDWPAVVAEYLAAHPPRAYQMVECVEALPDFVRQAGAWCNRYPFLPQLAQYELAEALLLRAVDPVTPENLSTDPPNALPDRLTDWAPVVNPVHQLVSGEYPIQSVVASLQTEQPRNQWLPIPVRPTHLWIYRDGDHRCRFYEVNVLVLAFLQQAVAQGTSGSYLACLETILGLQAHEWAVQHQFLAMVGQLQDAGLLLGSVPAGVAWNLA